MLNVFKDLTEKNFDPLHLESLLTMTQLQRLG